MTRSSGKVATRHGNRRLDIGLLDKYNLPVVYDELKAFPRPLASTIYAVKRELRVSIKHPLPRCKYIDLKKARALDLALGYSKEQIENLEGLHTAKGHVCDECRCDRDAGSGSRGWWYWGPDNDRGLPEVGHYGVGPCYIHSPFVMPRMRGVVFKGYRDRILEEMESMKEHGMSPAIAGGRWLEVRNEAKESEERIDIRTGHALIMDLVQKAVDSLHNYRNSRMDVDTCLNRILGECGIEDISWLEPEQQDRIREALLNRPLTEMAGGRQVAMSDKTAIELQLKMAKAAMDGAASVIDLDAANLFHRDELTMLCSGFMNLAERHFKSRISPEDWGKFQSEAQELGNEVEIRHMRTIKGRG